MLSQNGKEEAIDAFPNAFCESVGLAAPFPTPHQTESPQHMLRTDEVTILITQSFLQK